MKQLTKLRKSLLIFDLDGTLCHFTNDFKRQSNVQGIYSKGELEASPIYQDKTTAIFARPQLEKITHDLLVSKKKLYDVGVWSSSNMEDTELMIKQIFGRFYTQ